MDGRNAQINYEVRMTKFTQLIARANLWLPAFIVLVLSSPALNGGRNALVFQSDFGGLSMVGVAYSVSKEIDIFRLDSLIPLYDINAASSALGGLPTTWPAGTVFVSVVDPGVGTPRKSVVLKTKSGHYFVSPDNGTLSAVAKRYGIEAVREIDESVNRIRGSEWSHTFHGRDVYAFTGARLASGVISFAEVGPLMEPKVIMLESPPKAFIKKGVIHGIVSGGTGRLGNSSSNIDRHLFAQLGAAYGDKMKITIRHAGEIVWKGELPYVRSFGDVPLGESLLFVNAGGNMSAAINQGHFASTYKIGAGLDWTIEISK